MKAAGVTYQTRTDEAANMWVPTNNQEERKMTAMTSPRAEALDLLHARDMAAADDSYEVATDAEVVEWANQPDQAAWEPDETGDAIDWFASIDSHNLQHEDVWEIGL